MLKTYLALMLTAPVAGIFASVGYCLGNAIAQSNWPLAVAALLVGAVAQGPISLAQFVRERMARRGNVS